MTQDQIIEAVEKMTILELNTLVKAIKRSGVYPQPQSRSRDRPQQQRTRRPRSPSS